MSSFVSLSFNNLLASHILSPKLNGECSKPLFAAFAGESRGEHDRLEELLVDGINAGGINSGGTEKLPTDVVNAGGSGKFLANGINSGDIENRIGNVVTITGIGVCIHS